MPSLNDIFYGPKASPVARVVNAKPAPAKASAGKAKPQTTPKKEKPNAKRK